MGADGPRHHLRRGPPQRQLQGGDSEGSEFDGADIEGADFTDALLDDKTMRSLCKVASGATRRRGSTPATACSVIWAGWSASRSWTRLPSTASRSSTPPSAPPAVTEEAAVDKKSPPFF